MSDLVKAELLLRLVQTNRDLNPSGSHSPKPASFLAVLDTPLLAVG